MSDEEFIVFCGLLDTTFRGGLDKDRESALRIHFGRVPFDAAERCVARMVGAGQVFVPAPGELVTALRRVAGGDWRFSCLMDGETGEQRMARLNAQQDDRLLAPPASDDQLRMEV